MKVIIGLCNSGKAQHLDDLNNDGKWVIHEVENGIDTEMMETLVDALVPTDVTVSTYSPLFLNYLPDDVARESVILMPFGVKFFDLPGMREKLTVMGPGEVYADTDLKALVQHLAAFSDLWPKEVDIKDLFTHEIVGK